MSNKKNKKINKNQTPLGAPCWSQGPTQALSLLMPLAGSDFRECVFLLVAQCCTL